MNIQIKVSTVEIPYITAIKYLDKRVNEIKSNKGKELIWILEHPTTYTAGIRSNKNEIIDKNINIVSTDRGGKITLHNRGQKIVYFVLDLNKRKKDIRNLISVLERFIIDFLKIYKIKGNTDKKNIGIWVNDKKIAAIGIRISRWVAYHGCSINIENDLKKYKKIIPCGLKNKEVTSMKNERKKSFININKNLLKLFIKNLKNI